MFFLLSKQFPSIYNIFVDVVEGEALVDIVQVSDESSAASEVFPKSKSSSGSVESPLIVQIQIP